MIIVFLMSSVLFVLFIYSIQIAKKGNLVGVPLSLFFAISIILVVFPEYANKIANFVGVGRGADLLIYICFVSFLLMVLVIHLKFRRQEVMLTELARKIALLSVRK